MIADDFNVAACSDNGQDEKKLWRPRRRMHHTSRGEKHMGHGIIAWIIIGALAGWITGKIMKGSGFGFFMDMIVGLVGALIGGFLSSKLGLGGVGDHGLIISIAIAVVGAVILTWLVRLISGNRSAQL
jgi:uncharacterized membrane protein YeaQ/YmgE (transglycosylase-associated protein family)